MSEENTGERVWMDISNETSRTYILASGAHVVIKKPLRVGIRRSGFGDDSHTVHGQDGRGYHFPSCSFEAILWEGLGATQPDFSEELNAKMRGES
jgi:hypothetical protein